MRPGWWPPSRLLRSVALLAGAAVLGQALSMLTSPLLTRLYSPADFGALAVFNALLSILAVGVTLRYELAVPLARSHLRAANLMALATLLALAMSAAAALAVAGLDDRLLAWLAAPALRPYLWLLAPSLLAAGLWQVLEAWATRARAFAPLARARLAQQVAQVLLPLLLASQGTLGLLLGRAAGQLGGGRLLLHRFWRQERPFARSITAAGLWAAAWRFRRFPLLATASGLLSTAGTQAPALLLAGLYGPQAAGWFALGQRVIGAGMTFLGQAVGQVYASESARLAGSNPAALERLFRCTALRLFLVGLLPLVCLGWQGPRLFTLVFGAPWREAGRYAQLLAPAFLAQLVVAPLSYTLDVLELQDLELSWNLIRLIVAAGACLLPAAWDLPAATAVACYSLGSALCYLLLYAITTLEIRRLVPLARGR